MCKLRFAFFGSSILSAYWNGAATYYRGLIRALNKRGHSVTFFEPDAFDRQKHKDLEDTSFVNAEVYPSTQKGVHSSLKRALEYDIIIKASGVGVFDELLESWMPGLKNSNRKVLFWDVDAPATLDRMKSDANDYFRKLVPEYDYIFTYGGGDPVKKSYLEFGAKKCCPVYNALDPQTHYSVKPNERFYGDLGFLGNRMPDREDRVEEFFWKVAKNLTNKQFLLGGSGWNNVNSIDNVKVLGHVYTHEHNMFNSSVSTVLNINRSSMASYGYSPPTRIFEAAGAAACIITDEWQGIESFLEPDRECLVARSGEDVSRHIKSMDKEYARAIGRRAQSRVLHEHTYSHRAREVEQILCN
ncbi:MAG: glycosyltransferase [Chitinispirillaceae bacterium]|nr:glycosyltransferase [Chitinispirillaceae bacterium]